MLHWTALINYAVQ